MTSLYLPGATWRPVSYRGAAGAFGSVPLGWILHVVVGNGSPFNTFEHAPTGNRRFSTAWVAKDGSSEQYTELTNKSWAQSAGNGTYWSFETEGYPTEPLTDAQITTLARWHNFLGTPDTLAETPGQRGIGTHYMGGSAWGGHTCPDPVAGAGPRSHQRSDIIARAKTLRGPVGGFGTGIGGSGTYVPLPPINISTPPRKDQPMIIESADKHEVFACDLITKRYISDPATIQDYLKMSGQTSTIVIGQYTADRIPDYVPPTVDVNAIVKALPPLSNT